MQLYGKRGVSVIQKATKDMLSQLIALWSECFGDSEEYSSFFFQNKMIGTEVFENEYVYIVDGKVVSMLSILPAALIEEKKTRPFWYIYAVATKKEYRKNGYAGKLLGFILEKAVKENTAVGLVPANDALFKYYRKFGFETYFYHRILQFERNRIQEKKKREMSTKPIAHQDYAKLRNRRYQAEGVVVWDEDSVAYALKENKSLNGDAYEILYEGKTYFAVFCKSGEELLVRETDVPECLLQTVFCRIAEKEQCSKIRVIYFPNISNQEKNEEHGMIFNENSDAKIGYLGLALD